MEAEATVTYAIAMIGQQGLQTSTGDTLGAGNFHYRDAELEPLGNVPYRICQHSPE